jgi:hypothetical protein
VTGGFGPELRQRAYRGRRLGEWQCCRRRLDELGERGLGERGFELSERGLGERGLGERGLGERGFELGGGRLGNR